MKVAFVHDWLVYPGGAEKVFFDIVKEILGKTDKYYFSNLNDLQQVTSFRIFTTFYNLDFKLPSFIGKENIESVLQGKNIGKIYRNLFPIFPILQKKLSGKIDKFNPDLVIISSFAIGKNIDFSGQKLLYLHSPMQYIWSHYKEYLSKFSGFKKQVFKFSTYYLRKWDKKYVDFDYVIANSNYTKLLANQIYGMKINEVVFPKVEIPSYSKVDVVKKYNLPKNYYLYVGRLVRLVKHVDKLIEVFNKKPNLQLVIVGDGPDKEYLKKLAKKNIKFLGYIDSKNDDYWNLIENSKAVINLTKESFGIVNYQVGKLGKTLISINDGAIGDIPGKKILIDKIEELGKVLE